MHSVIALPLIAGSAIALARVPFIAHLGFSALPLAISHSVGRHIRPF